MTTHLPRLQGLYDPQFEHDACGIGFVARLSGAPSHEILTQALTAVGNMAHRGGVAADGKTGDGAGVMTQIPRAFFARELARMGIAYDADDLSVGVVFLPTDAEQAERARAAFADGVAACGLTVLGWRDIPVEMDVLGASARESCPGLVHALVGRDSCTLQGAAYEQQLYIARKQIEALARERTIPGFFVASLSARTIVYKGLLVAPLLPDFFTDLRDPEYTTAVAVYHQRYSTNTFPTWERAQPFRMLAHNGEINTLQGNVMWMRAREAEWRAMTPDMAPDGAYALSGPTLATTLAKLGPVVDTSGSDSAMLDNTLELLVLGGRDIRHALTMLVPEAWEHVQDMDPAWRAFYQYHAGLMEPWDGPAALAFFDGDVVGLALDRNGLRPARYLVTSDGLVVCGSEVGAVEIDDARVIRKGKVGPGQMIAADLRTGLFETNADIKSRMATEAPYAAWLSARMQVLSPAGKAHLVSGYEPKSSAEVASASPLLGELQHAFGYTAEELNVVLRPMLRDGQEPVGSMGDDTGPAIFSNHSRPLYNYFKQRFAEVTNPPIDPIREALVMSFTMALGRRGNLLDSSADHAHLLRLNSPVLTDEHLALIRQHHDPAFASATLKTLFPANQGPRGLKLALDRLCKDAERAIAASKIILILSDRGIDEEQAPVPALLALGAVHHHLVRLGLRTSVSLVVESGEPREVHHLACLVGMGAEAINPYVALATVRAIATERDEVAKGKIDSAVSISPEDAEHNYIHALEKGLLKIMSKMGIATADSYCGAQMFEALGVSRDIIDQCFTGVPSRLGGIGYEQIANTVLHLHDEAFSSRLPAMGSRTSLANPGFYKFKKDGEYHSYAPPVVHALQKAANGGDYAAYKAYSDLVHKRPPTELRDLLAVQTNGITPIELSDVEPVEAIVTRFSTAAMSLGSTSSEAHETLAIAMNRLGGLSNCGEGGEDPARYGDERNSPIKQVASGRFGVTPAYLAAASELQIKMAQGSKPGEGGQLPGHKVTEEIARVRHTVPGVQLISPPPHHDIYSIEDLSQLIYDLKQVNPAAAVSVKLVAEAGVGTIAAGVAKGGADVVHMSGHSGGTGASPLSSIKNAGVNWELGLAEAQQTLVLNNLRSRVRVRVDGGMKTGKDVIVAALLGADEFSFGTAALVAEGCIMARACHNNTCPVGIATQRPELRAKFKGTPEHVIHFFLHIAEEVREELAKLGARTLHEIVGRSDLLAQVKRNVAEADMLDLTALIQRVDRDGAAIRNTEPWNGMVTTSELNAQMLADAAEAIRSGTPVAQRYSIGNCDRSVGATLSGAVGGKHGEPGLPEGTINLTFHGSAGQSFGAFNAPGVHLTLVGESNDYVGKGMGGGEIVVRPSERATFATHESTIIGNTVLYGATGGALFAAGQAGERFAVRNSGGVAVVEGVGDHGCEYMTGGVVLVLGQTGRNFAAGMTGGLAYVFDERGTFGGYCNTEMCDLHPLDAQDEANIRTLLVRHMELTNSPRAADLLARWEDVRGQFVAVRPHSTQAPRLPAMLLELREKALTA